MSKTARLLFALALTSLVTACMSRPDPRIINTGFGSLATPIKADMPMGQRDYLARLRCPLGDRPEPTRLGSYGAQGDGHVIDGYVLTCNGKPDVVIFMDMYHPGHVEAAAPEGFTIKPASHP